MWCCLPDDRPCVPPWSDRSRNTTSPFYVWASEPSTVRLHQFIRLPELPRPSFGWPESNDVILGEPILNLGSPGGRGIVVTSGILSGVNVTGGNALALATQQSDGFDQMLQFDAASNPGNSGGALVNMDGRQIGMVVASIRSEEGIHFAVPMSTIRQSLPNVLHSELRQRYVSGLKVAGKINIPTVTNVIPDSPASKAGIEVGDEIIAIDGRKIRDVIDWHFTQLEWQPKQSVRLTVRREMLETDMNIELADRQPQASIPETTATAPGLRCRSGVYDAKLPNPLGDQVWPGGTPEIIASVTAQPPGAPRDDHYEVLIEGLLEIEKAGLCRIGVSSDDGSKLYVHGRLIADNGGNHASQVRSGWIDVAAGKHPIRIEYYEDEGQQELQLLIASGDDELQPVEAKELFHQTNEEPQSDSSAPSSQ